MPYSVSWGAAGATAGVLAPKRIYVLGVEAYGGLGAPPCLNRVYDLEKDSWVIGAAMPTSRLNFGVAVVNDRLYAIGGFVYCVLGFIAPSAVNEQYTPFGYGTVPPVVAVLSPENDKAYNVSDVSLVFAVNRPVVWLGYSLDGQDKVTITGNITLAGLANGLHNVTVYARDEFGNMGASEAVCFTIAKELEPFPVVPIAAASGVAIVSVAVCVVYYCKKRSH